MRFSKIFILIFILVVLTPILLAEKFYSYHNHRNQLVFSNRKPLNDEAEIITEHEIDRDQPYLMQFDTDRYNRYDDLILKHSRNTGVDFNLVKSVILVESNFNHKAVSPKGAIGLMQLIPDTAKRFGVSNSFDPDENISGGCRYLQFLIEMFDGNLELVLSSYNAGENLVKRIQRVPNYKETKNYVKKVIEIYGRDDTRLTEQLTVYTPRARFYQYVDENGVITLSNVDPPKGAKPVK